MLKPIFLSFLLLFPTAVFGKKITKVEWHDPQDILPQEDYLPLLLCQEGTSFQKIFLESDQTTLVRELKKKGYLLGTVKITVKNSAHSEGIILRYEIQGGLQFVIGKLFFQGNGSIPSSDLESAFIQPFPISEKAWYNPYYWFVPAPRIYQNGLEEEGKKNLVSLLHQYGFFDGKILKMEKKIDSRNGRVDFSIQIFEGPAYQISQIHPPNMSPFFQKMQGKVFRYSIFQKRVKEIIKLFQDEGYFFAKIHYTLYPLSSQKKVEIHLQIKPGPRIRLGKIEFEGHQTKDQFLRNHLSMHPGDFLTRKKWDETQKKLSFTGLFKKIQMDLKKSEIQNLYNLKIKVQQKAGGKLSLFGGLSSEFGPFIGSSFDINNFSLLALPWLEPNHPFLGGGEKLKIQGFFGEQLRQGNLIYQKSYLFNSPLYLNLKSSYRQWKLFPYLEQRIEGLVALGRSYPFGSIEIGGQWQDFKLLTTSPLPQDLLQLKNGLQLGSLFLNLRFPLSYNGLEGVFSPHFEMGHAYFGSEKKYYKIQLFQEIQWKPVVGLLFRMEGEIGTGKSNHGTPLPYPIRFFLGGSSTLRGFSYGRVGGEELGFPKGGSTFWRGRGEIHVQIWKWVWIIGFLDTGDLGDSLPDLGKGRIRLSGGGGFRFYFFSSKFPLALDFGFPIFKEPEDQKEIFSFSLDLIF